MNLLNNPVQKLGTLAVTLLFGYSIYKKNSKKQTNQTVLVGAIELGGTFCSIAIVSKIYTINKNQKILQESIIQDKIKINTQTPDKTLKEIYEYLNKFDIQEIGIASFGPLDLNYQSSNYGSITTTPKKQWIKYSILQELQKLFPKIQKFSIDTDVNVCAKAEYLKGGHCVKNSLAYITVGTGVGVGLVINGQTVHGLLHPEGGHTLVPSLNYKGICEKHPNCVEGYVSNNAIAQKLSCKIENLPDLPDTHQIWDEVAESLAILCVNICLICSPEVIIIGGGVMNREILFPKIQQKFKFILNGYIQNEILDQPDLYIRKPGLQSDVGLIGAAILSDN